MQQSVTFKGDKNFSVNSENIFIKEGFENRITVPEAVGRGEIVTSSLRPDLSLVQVEHDITINNFSAVTDPLPDIFQFPFHTSADKCSGLVRESQYKFDFTRGDSLIFSPDSTLESYYHGQQLFSVTMVSINRTALTPFLSEYGHLLPSSFTGVCEKDDYRNFFHKSIIDSETRGVLALIHSCGYTGKLKQFYLEARAMELVVLRLSHLFRDPEKITHFSLKPNEMERLYLAREILIKRMENPPTIVELAKLVRLNEFKLKKGFRECFQTTLFGYLREERLKKAYELLTNGNKTVTEVALEVGYCNLGHFSNQFRKKFGKYPSSV